MSRPKIYRAAGLAVVVGSDPDEPVSIMDESRSPWPYGVMLAGLSIEHAAVLAGLLEEAVGGDQRGHFASKPLGYSAPLPIRK